MGNGQYHLNSLLHPDRKCFQKATTGLKSKAEPKWYSFRTVCGMKYKHNDRFGIYMTHETEVRQLAKKLNYPIDEVLVAIQEVGFNEEEIEEYIRDRTDRSL